MILPQSKEDRQAVYGNTIRESMGSQERRRAYHKRLRGLALNGADGSQVVHQNKLWEWAETSSAYCFAPEFVKFGVTLPRRYGDQFLEELDAVRDEASDLFLNSGLDKTGIVAVKFAHFMPCMFAKVITSDNSVTPKLIEDPADVCVWEENLPFEEQEALVHTFDMNFHSVVRLISGAFPEKADRDRLIGLARELAQRGPSGSILAPAVPRLVLAAASPNMIGAVQNMPSYHVAEPEVEADVVPMCELWIRDDMAHAICDQCHHRESDDHHKQGPLYDHKFEPSGEHEWEWRVVRAMGKYGDNILWTTLNPLLPQRHPFRQLCLSPLTNYAYGMSPMEPMVNLQLMSEDLLAKHDRLLDLQLDPPVAIIGMSNVDGERAKLLRAPGGTFTMPFSAGADIKRFAPETPPDTAGMHKLIDEKFDRMGGLPMGAAGASPDANVRSAGQMTAGAALSSPRINQRAMLVEDWLEDVMTDALRLHRRISKEPLRIPLTQPDQATGKNYRSFYLSQIPGDLNVRVSAHSASPLFRNEMREVAIILRREQAIGKESFVELLAPPLEDILRPKARQIEAGEAKAKERLVEVKEREAAAKEAKARRV